MWKDIHELSFKEPVKESEEIQTLYIAQPLQLNSNLHSPCITLPMVKLKLKLLCLRSLLWQACTVSEWFDWRAHPAVLCICVKVHVPNWKKLSQRRQSINWAVCFDVCMRTHTSRILIWHHRVWEKTSLQAAVVSMVTERVESERGGGEDWVFWGCKREKEEGRWEMLRDSFLPPLHTRKWFPVCFVNPLSAVSHAV